MRNAVARGALPLSFLLSAAVTGAAVTFSPMFTDHLVLQRGQPAPVWGTAAAGEEVTVELAADGQALQTKKTTADARGRWLVKLDPLTARAEPATLRASTKTPGDRCEVADVLVGEVWLGSGQSNMAGASKTYRKNDAALEGLVTSASYPLLRLRRSGDTAWREATPDAIDGFSALLFSFGVRLQKELNVPVGLLVGAVGGTPSGFWISPEAFDADAECRKAVEKARAEPGPLPEQKAYEAARARWQREADAAKAAGREFKTLRPQPPLDPGECRGQMGNLYVRHIRPFIPYGIRGVLWDQGESGTQVGAVDQFTLMGALIAGWRKEWGQGNFPFLYIQKPSGGGVAWDRTDPVTVNASAFAPLPSSVPADGAYRELHLRIRAHPNTAMVTASDLGAGVHPTNKSGYGARAARVALGFVYGKKVEIYGPIYARHAVDGDRVRVAFRHVGKGLASRPGDRPQGFALAGADRKFVWAEAAIEGDEVVVWSDRVPQPVAVRYAWASMHPWANLFNRDGLPALPFRTDSW